MTAATVAVRDGDRVLDAARGLVVAEHGMDRLTEMGAAGRLAVVAHFSTASQATRSVDALVRELRTHGYHVAMVSSASAEGPLRFGSADSTPDVILRQPNIGYDFGSWAIGIDHLPGARTCENVILANDSMLGPFTGLGPYLRAFEESPADVWGMTEARQFWPHLQSYFVGYRRGVLAEPVLSEFWATVRHRTDKDRIIRDNELELGLLLRREGYSVDAAYRNDDVVEPGLNPVIRGWNRLLDRGFPLVKRQILREPEVAPGGTSMPRRVMELFGQDVEQW